MKKEKEGGRGRVIKSLMFKVGRDEKGEGKVEGGVGSPLSQFKAGWD